MAGLLRTQNRPNMVTNALQLLPLGGKIQLLTLSVCLACDFLCPKKKWQKWHYASTRSWASTLAACTFALSEHCLGSPCREDRGKAMWRSREGPGQWVCRLAVSKAILELLVQINPWVKRMQQAQERTQKTEAKDLPSPTH